MSDILTNRKARHDFHILETFEAGIVLKGTEVKALRAGKGQIRDAYARIENDEAFLYVHTSMSITSAISTITIPEPSESCS